MLCFFVCLVGFLGVCVYVCFFFGGGRGRSIVFVKKETYASFLCMWLLLLELDCVHNIICKLIYSAKDNLHVHRLEKLIFLHLLFHEDFSSIVRVKRSLLSTLPLVIPEQI